MDVNVSRRAGAGGHILLAAAASALALLLACSRSSPPRSASLPDGIVGALYRASVPGSDEAASWRLAGGALPDGLALEPASGAVHGTPSRDGEFALEVVGLDRTPEAVRRLRLTLRVRPGALAAASPALQPPRWEGTYDYRMLQRVPSGDQISTAHVKIDLTEEGGGVLGGTADGTVDATLTLSTCPSHTVRPATFHADLTGTRTSERMELVLASESWGPIQITPCPSGGMPGVIGGGKIYRVDEALSSLTSQDGRVYRFQLETTYPAGEYPFTVTHKVEVHRVEGSP